MADGTTLADLLGVAAIAGCWLRRAPITLLDEPTNNLDEVTRQAVLEMVRTWLSATIGPS